MDVPVREEKDGINGRQRDFMRSENCPQDRPSSGIGEESRGMGKVKLRNGKKRNKLDKRAGLSRLGVVSK
jgi:hypothetical protein